MDILGLLANGGNPRPLKAVGTLQMHLKRHGLSIRDVTEFLKIPGASPVVIGHPQLRTPEQHSASAGNSPGVYASNLTRGRLYPISEVKLSDDWNTLRVSITDDDGLHYESAVQVVNSFAEAQSPDLVFEQPLLIALDSVRKELYTLWKNQISDEADALAQRFVDYEKVEHFTAGDLVCYKGGMMVPGGLPRHGLAIVVQTSRTFDNTLPRSPDETEKLNLTIGVIDSDGDFALMNVSSKRLRKVPSDQVGTFNNPYRAKRWKDDSSEEPSTIEASD